jgi:DNA repair protein RecO (recombination protein O)
MMSVRCAAWVITTYKIMRVEHQPAYVLHLKPYRDTSAIVDLLTPDYGRISVVVRGVRKSKSPKRQLLNPFHGLLVSFQGNGDLKLLTHFESHQRYFTLAGSYLYSGFYLNELLVRLLPEMDAHNDLFSLYESSIQCLHQQLEIEPVLRRFEFRLLLELGYAISFTEDAIHHLPIKPNASYRCDLDHGFIEVDQDIVQELNIRGEDLLAIEQHNYSQQSTRRAAKNLTRYLLKPLLGKKPLKSRELFFA